MILPGGGISEVAIKEVRMSLKCTHKKASKTPLQFGGKEEHNTITKYTRLSNFQDE